MAEWEKDGLTHRLARTVEAAPETATPEKVVSTPPSDDP
jgi:hypothetical protein